MRILAFILSIVITTALLMGGVVLLVVRTDDASPYWLVAATFAMVMFVYGPLLLGSFRAYWDFTGSDDSRRYFRRVLLVVLGLELLAAAVTVVFAILTSTGALVPVVFIGSGVVLTAIALLVGPAMYRYDQAHRSPTSAWVAIDPSQITRRILATVITFVGVVVLGIIAAGILNTVAPNQLTVGETVSFALEIAFFVSGFVCVVSTLGWNRRLRDVTDRDPARLRRVARVVLRNKNIDLDARDQVAAARYAAVISVTMSFQLAYIVLLYAGLVLQQVISLRGGFGDGISLIAIVFLVVVLVALLPLQVVRIRRARTYSRTHGAAVDEHVASHGAGSEE